MKVAAWEIRAAEKEEVGEENRTDGCENWRQRLDDRNGSGRECEF